MPVATSAAYSVASAILPVVTVLFGLAILASLAPRSRANPRGLAYVIAVLASIAILGLGAAVLAAGEPVDATAGSVLGFALIALHFDALSALFLIALGAVGIASSMYAIGYAAHEPAGIDRTAAAYPIFLASLALVFGASNAIAFLFAWEVMALSSAALVVGARPNTEVARAGYVYLALTHLASAALVIAFAVLAAAAGSPDFAAFDRAAAGLGTPARDALFLLFLVGFGTKAGAIPLHVWLPRAHPVAPSHVSALMSGVMIKAGIYGLVRFGLEILGPGPEWWGLLILGIGVLSAVLGVLYALMEHDLKRLLAFHSIENIGIILIGVGVAMLAVTHGAESLAALALAAALFHTLNHALFKSVLFLAAGSVQAAVGSRDLNLLGGLVRVMPVTALAFAIGAAAISGLPPLNGFASEWLTFQGLLGAGGAGGVLSPLARSASLLAIGGLGLTAALAVACFVKATGVGFLALPRSAGAAAARESSRSMGAAMLGLVAACVGVGLAAGPVARGISGIANTVVGAAASGGTAFTGPAAGARALGATALVGSAPVAGPAPVTGPAPDLLATLAGVPGADGAFYGAVGIALLLVGVAAAIWFVGLRRRPVRRVPTWTCGVVPEPAFEYTASSYAKLIRLYFGRILRPAREVSVELHPGTPFPRTIRYHGEARHVLDERVYGPLHRAAVAAAQLARRLQNGSLQLYLAYTVTAVVILLVLAR